MNFDAERRMIVRRDRLLNIIQTSEDKIAELEFQNAELVMRDRKRAAAMKQQAEEIKRLSVALTAHKNMANIDNHKSVEMAAKEK